MKEKAKRMAMTEMVGKHERGAETVFDAMMAEILSDKLARTQKFLRTHDRRGKVKDKRKAYRKELCYSCDPWHGSEPVKHYRHREQVKSLYADFNAELSAHEDAMAEYYDAMYWVTAHEDSAESLLDERIDGYMTPERIAGYRKTELAQAEIWRESAMIILKGECY